MLTLDLDNQTEKRFNKLLDLNDKNYSKLINSLYDYRINELQMGIKNIESDFWYYENKYQMSSADFFEKYEKGSFDEKSHLNDFMIWSSEYETYLQFKNELNLLL